MKLTRSQKKFLKKNLKQLFLKEIAQKLDISEKEICVYLESIWSKEKYHKFLNKQNHSLKVETPEEKNLFSKNKYSGNKFNLGKEWFKQNQKVFIFLSFLVFIIYFNSLANDFVSDDIPAIVKNENIGNLFFSFRQQPLNFLRYFFYFLIYKIWGLNPTFFRLLGILFHLGSVFVIYTLIFFLYNFSLALIVASLFSVHPVLSEAVVWISGGAYPQYTFFVLLSFLFYLLAKKFNKKKKIKYYLISLLSFFLALLTTEKAVVLALIILFYEIATGKLAQNWKKLTPFFLLSGLWLFSIFSGGILSQRMTVLESQYYQEGGLYNPLLQIPISLVSYMRLIFWPDKLTLYHSEMSFAQNRYLTMLVITLILLGIIIYSFFKKKHRSYFFWLSFFIISLLPMLTPFKIAWLVAERYVYLGSLGIFVVVGMVIQNFSQKVKVKNKKIIYSILGVILLLLAVRTMVRNVDWKNQDSLWLAAGKTSPSSSQNHNNLGDLYGRRGEFDKAEEHFLKAIELKPGYADAYHNLGNIYQHQGQFDLAKQNYHQALKFNPQLWQSHLNLAAIYYQENKITEAKQELEAVLKIDPDNQQVQQALLIISKEGQ